ncbi:hypothetical protein Ddc_05257 [Ditylenchus destructor]|nr:hypothetical protein Ddc_05257 [Ditylenchus destructor]
MIRLPAQNSRRFLNLVLLTLLLFVVIAISANNDDEIPSYLTKIQELRQSANQKRSQRSDKSNPNSFVTNKKNKPKRYKCILIDDDEEESTGKEIELTRLERMKQTATQPSFMKELKIKARIREPTENQMEVEKNYNNEYSFVAESEPMQNREMEAMVHLRQENKMKKESFNVASRPLSRSTGKPLRQVTLPRAQGIPLQKRLEQMSNESPKPVTLPNSNNNSSNASKQTLRVENIPRDSNNRPLILSPENCKMIESYAGMYGVKDIKSWVHHNCAFAKMYLPTATCEEIDILVASCYPTSP